LRWGGRGRLGLFHPRAGGHGVCAHFHGFLRLLRGLGRVLALCEGLLNDTARFARRDSPAAFEGARAGAASGQQHQGEPDREEGSQTFDSRRELIHRTLDFGLRTLDCGPWTLGFGLWTRDFRRWRGVWIDRSPQLQPAGVDAPLDVRGLGSSLDRLLFDSHIRLHVLSFVVTSAQKQRRPDLFGSDASGPSKN
jgi:hypothetical protein